MTVKFPKTIDFVKAAHGQNWTRLPAWVFRYSMIEYIFLEMINIHEFETFVRLTNIGKTYE